jgi:Amt family ammonium transporter
LSLLILKVIDWTLGLRVDEEQEQVGLDLSLHEEKAYNLS